MPEPHLQVKVQAPSTAGRQGFFLSVIQQFKEIFDMRKITDPFVVAGKLMQEIGYYRAINKVHVADKAVDKKERYKARAIIIYINTLFHKRQAAIKLKKFLQRNPKLKATASDVFPSTETPRALALTRYAADKIYHKSITRTRVINKSGTAILQHTEEESKQFKDSVVTEADLDPYYQPRESGERERKADRKRRNRDEKMLRDQDRAASRGNNSCGQSSFNYNQGQTQQQLPQRTGKQQQTANPPLKISSRNIHPLPISSTLVSTCLWVISNRILSNNSNSRHTTKSDTLLSTPSHTNHGIGIRNRSE
jgi:hypothetical protein